MANEYTVLNRWNLSADFQRSAQFAVDDAVRLLLAGRDIDWYKITDPLDLVVKPMEMEAISATVQNAINYRAAFMDTPSPLHVNGVDVTASMKAITRDCLHQCEKIKPQFMTLEQ